MLFSVLMTGPTIRRAMRLRKLLADFGYDLRLCECQDLIAQMMGYRNRHDFRRCAGREDPSPADVEKDPETQSRCRHVEVLCAAGIRPEHAEVAVAEFRPMNCDPEVYRRFLRRP